MMADKRACSTWGVSNHLSVCHAFLIIGYETPVVCVCRKFGLKLLFYVMVNHGNCKWNEKFEGKQIFIFDAKTVRRKGKAKEKEAGKIRNGTQSDSIKLLDYPSLARA